MTIPVTNTIVSSINYASSYAIATIYTGFFHFDHELLLAALALLVTVTTPTVVKFGEGPLVKCEVPTTAKVPVEL